MPQLSKDSPLLAIDLGGTKIATGIVSQQGEIVSQEYVPTLPEEGPDAVISRMLLSIDSVVKKTDLPRSTFSRIAIAAAGAIDSDRGIVTHSPNLPGWEQVRLRQMIEEATGLQTLLINDASAAALGEHWRGIGKGVDDLIYITVSTGIGGGIILGGNLYTGASGSAGEIGHMTIDVDGPHCSCGNTGCLEVMASGRAIARKAQQLITEGARSAIVELVEGTTENVTAKVVAEAAQNGDAVASRIILEAATYLGAGMVNLVNIFNPDMIIVGGGMSKMGDMLLGPARQVVAERAFQLPAQRVRIVPSRLGDSAALLGAVAFALGLA